MKIEIDQVSSKDKWGMAAKGLTGALSAHLKAIYDLAGKKEYSKIIHLIWSEIGKGSAEAMSSDGFEADNLSSLAQAGVTTCICAMGPEYNIEEAENSDGRVVMKITECPWQNRMKELDISTDLLTACDTAFWNEFTENLNPQIKMKHGKQMHRGDPYCEWIFEWKKKRNQ